MKGNIAFDVVIGIVFIYLLYSLYATIIMEMISSFLGLRSKNLCYALERMLRDEKKYNLFTGFLARTATTFLRLWGRSANMKNDELYKKFFRQSSIKYLSSGGLGNRPSYLSSDNFYQGLMDSIKLDDPDFSTMAAFEAGLIKLKLELEEKQVEKLRNELKLSKEQLNDKPSYQDSPETISEEELKEKKVLRERLEEMSKSDTYLFLQSLIDKSNSDPLKFKIMVENWYNDTMDRASGWFKQSTQFILVFVGFIIVIVFNVDSLAIIKKLSTDKDARAGMVKMATEYIEKNKQAPPLTASDSNLQAKLDTLRAFKDAINQEILNSQSLISGGWNVPDSVYYLEGPSTIITDTANIKRDAVKINLGTGHIIVALPADTILIKNLLADGDYKNATYIQVNTFSNKLFYILSIQRIWGYLLTVLALSLGAPFWFDLLNKLVKLRSSKPTVEGTPDTKSLADSNRDILNRVG